MERQWRYFLVLIWLGYTLFCGVHIFSNGFLLTRVVQKERTPCVSFPDACPANETHCTLGTRINQYLNNANLSDSICLPKKSRVILLVIDALKYDFGIYDPGLRKPLAYQNRMPIFSEMLQKHPRRSRMLKFMADPPTTTMQRLKGLTTGSLPTFIDIGSNFASPEINEDNIVDQIVDRNMTAVFLGDSTWTDLFPGRFSRAYSYPSFNIFDLDTVDRRIEKYLPGELRETDWDLLVAHFLGVDHCGHKHGPLHREMSRKLGEMDAVVRRVIEEMANDTMLLVIGDHGMTSNGDHGGDSADELTSLIFAYAKGNDLTMNVNGNSEMQQIDLVPTLAAIFGVPIPYSNLGSIRMDLLPEVKKAPRMETLLLHMWQNAKQIQKYFKHYASTNLGTFRPDHIDDLENKFLILSHRVNSIYSEAAFVNFASDLQAHLRGVLVACHNIWVRFDAESMTNGLLIAILTVFGCFLLFHNLKVRQLERLFSTSIVTFIYASNVICIVSIVVLKWILTKTINSIMLYMAAFNILILGLFIIQHWSNIVENWSEIGKFSNTITRTVYLVLVIIFFSNSFIIQEPKILTYILTGMLLHVLFELKRAFLPDGKRQIKLLAIFSSVPMQLIGLATIAMFCLRIAHMFFQCREEHGNCLEFVGNPTGGGGGKSQAVARRKLDLIAVVAVALFATLTRIYLRSCGNLSGYSWNTILARYGPTLATICTSGYFLLSPKNGTTSGIPQIHIDAMAWIVGGIFLVQMVILVFRPLMIYVVPQGMVDDTVNTGRLIPDLFRRLKTIYGEDRENRGRSKIPIICGLGTVYSSTMVSYFVIFTILLSLLLGTKAATGLLVTILVAAVFIILTGVLRYQTAKSFESCLQPTFATLVVWLLLIHFTFYTTSHQTTLSQIDWHPAFVGRTAYHDHSNIISASLVIISTFCGAILLGTIFPLVTLAPFFIYSALPNLATYHRDMAPERRPERLKTSNNVEYRKVNISRADDDDEVTGEETMNMVEYDITKGELNLFENEALFIGAIFKSACQLMALQGLRIFCSMLACTIHCRHLMVWKIFAPRFIYEGISTYVLLGAILFSYLMLIRIHRAVVNLIVKFTKFN